MENIDNLNQISQITKLSLQLLVYERGSKINKNLAEKFKYTIDRFENLNFQLICQWILFIKEF